MPYSFYFVSTLQNKVLGPKGSAPEQSLRPEVENELYFHEDIGFRYELKGLSLEEASIRPWLTRQDLSKVERAMKDLYLSSLSGVMLRDFWKQRLRRVNFDAFLLLVARHIETAKDETGFILEQIHFWKPHVWKI